jgi:hypothetical protein
MKWSYDSMELEAGLDFEDIWSYNEMRRKGNGIWW